MPSAIQQESRTQQESRGELTSRIDKRLSKSQRIREISQKINATYLKGLSSRQSADILIDMGIMHLNEKSAFQFLRCAGLEVLKQHVDSTGNVHIPKHYQTCKKMSFQERRQAVGLLSFPGSGNSWVR